MGKVDHRFPGQKGIVNFLPLVLVAVLLIGFVGYFSVSRLRDRLNSSVLGESNTNVSIESDLESELEAGSRDLDSVGEIDESFTTGIELKSSPGPAGDANTDSGGSVQVEAGSEGDLVFPEIKGYKPTYKFLGVLSVKLSEDSALLRYLGFLFSK